MQDKLLHQMAASIEQDVLEWNCEFQSNHLAKRGKLFVFFVPHCITLIVYSDSSATYVVDKEGEGGGGGGSRAGTVVGALAFHQCGPGSIIGFCAICGLSLLVLYSAPRGFSPGTPVFPSPQKPTFAGVAQLASARLSEQGVPSSILGDFNVCFHFPLTCVATALNIRETEH